MNYQAVDLPKNVDNLFASIATDAGSVATVIGAVSVRFHDCAAVTLIDWSQDDLSPRNLARIVPATAASLADLRNDIRVHSDPPDTIIIDTGGAGGPLCEQAQAAGFEQVEAITEQGALKYPLLPDRALAAAFYLTCGAVAVTKSAFEYDLLHKGVFGNRIARALKAFNPDSKEAREPGVLLVAVVNAVLEAFVDPRLKGRAMTEGHIR